MKALGHPARVRILRLLNVRTRCFYGSIADEFPLAASTVSQHLRILRDVGLVQVEVEGPRTCYCINRERLARAAVLLEDLAGTHPAGTEPPIPASCANSAHEASIDGTGAARALAAPASMTLLRTKKRKS